MRTTRPGWGVAGVVCLALALAGGAPGAASAPGGTLTVGLDQEPPTIDPHASPSAVTYQITSSVLEALLFQGLDGKVVPWLATGYTVSPDGRSFTFTLRKDAQFSDGAPVNAAAVKWNFDRIVDPSFKAGGALVALTGYAGSTVVDEFTVRVNFKQAYAPFLTYAAGGTLALVSPKTTPTQGDAVNQKPVGSGPFVVTEYAQKDHITIARNPQYNRRAPWSDHQGPPFLDRIVFKIIPEAGTRVTTIESGETQMISALNAPAAVLRRLENNKGLRVERNPYPGAPRIWLLNVTIPPTNDLKVRQAINYGVNRPAFVESVYKGLGRAACAPLTQHMLADPSLCQAYPYDPAKAAQLLDEAGWKMGPNNVRMKDGKPLVITINSINYGAGNLPEIELLQGQLLQLGIDARIKSQARPPWYEDNYHCATSGPVMFLRDTDWNGLYALFHSATVHGNFNWSCYANPEVDRLIAQGREEFDPAKRRALYLKIERILVDQAVTVPLIDEFSVWVLRGTVKGTTYNYSAYPVLSDVSIEK
jgi:peptide/nickel transport system substrate-binding protein